MSEESKLAEAVERYDPAEIEPRWQARWEQDGLHRARVDRAVGKFYFLTMLPYTSGDLHIGHWYAMAPSDARARYLSRLGHNVMFPIGFDAFGLPAENAAIERGIHPKEWTYANIENMRKQLRSMGAMFMVRAPEHPLVERLTAPEHAEAVRTYVQQALRQSDIQREAADKDKTGVFTGGYAVNPVNGERIPVWIADYVLMSYGTGAIMAVPAHDQRDFEFARKFGLEIRPVIQPAGGPPLVAAEMAEAVVAYGEMINSGPLSCTPEERTIEATIAYLEQNGLGQRAVGYRLRDWLISRQRYWGAPIPIIYCPEHGQVPVPEDQLPGG